MDEDHKEIKNKESSSLALHILLHLVIGVLESRPDYVNLTMGKPGIREVIALPINNY